MKISQAFYELHTFPVFIVWSRKPYQTANFTSVWQNHIILQTRAVRTLMPCCAHVSFPVFIVELWSCTHYQPANFYMRLAKSHYIASTCCAHSDAMLYTCEFSWIYFIGARASHSINQPAPQPFCKRLLSTTSQHMSRHYFQRWSRAYSACKRTGEVFFEQCCFRQHRRCLDLEISTL